MYWTGFTGRFPKGAYPGKTLFVFQGAAPETWMLDAGEFTMKRFAALYGLTYMGMAKTLKKQGPWLLPYKREGSMADIFA